MTQSFLRTTCLISWFILLSSCSSSEPQVPQRTTPVRTQIAVSGPASPAIITSGIVTPKEESRLSFKVSGLIKAIHVEEGDSVKVGQRLAEIEMTEIDSQVEEIRQLADKANRDLVRGEQLYAEDKVISLTQLEGLRTEAALRQAQLKSARFNRSYSVITATRAGTVLRKLAQVRELIPAGEPVLILGSKERGFVVRAALADREIVQLKVGDPAEIRMDAFPQQAIAGTVSLLASAADQNSGLFPVEVRFASVPVNLVSGLVAKLSLYPAASRSQSLVHVPVGAVIEGDGEQASVFVVQGQRVKRRNVRVAFISSQAVALASGVEAGEQIVTDGALYLENDELIEVLRDAG
jgi:membrane fusion protein, multidrug efflux system